MLVWRSFRKIIYYLLKWRGDFPPFMQTGMFEFHRCNSHSFNFFSNGRVWPLIPFQTIQQQHFPPGLESWIKLYISHFLTVLAFLPEREEKPYKVSSGPNPKTSSAAGGSQIWLWRCPQWGLWGGQEPPGPFWGGEMLRSWGRMAGWQW